MQVIVIEKETGAAAVFLCNEWLSSDRGEGAVSRDLLPTTGEYLLQPHQLQKQATAQALRCDSREVVTEGSFPLGLLCPTPAHSTFKVQSTPDESTMLPLCSLKKALADDPHFYCR